MKDLDSNTNRNMNQTSGSVVRKRKTISTSQSCTNFVTLENQKLESNQRRSSNEKKSLNVSFITDIILYLKHGFLNFPLFL